MITQAIFEEIHNVEIATLYQKVTESKTITERVIKNNIKIFLQPVDGDKVRGVIPGVSFKCYIFTNQLEGIKINIDDKLELGDDIVYRIVTDGKLMNQSPFMEPHYVFDLEKTEKSGV